MSRQRKRRHTITIPIANAVNKVSPHLPVLNTNPLPLAITHALSSPFGSTYIANSPRRLFSSTNSDRPAANPGTQNDTFEMSKSTTHCGMCVSEEVSMDGERAPVRSKVRNLWSWCL